MQSGFDESKGRGIFSFHQQIDGHFCDKYTQIHTQVFSDTTLLQLRLLCENLSSAFWKDTFSVVFFLKDAFGSSGVSTPLVSFKMTIFGFRIDAGMTH